MAQNLVVAFAAVIVALLSASITFVVHSVRRRWLLEELDGKLRRLETRLETVESQYVKREDWMRLSTTVEAKLDVVSARLDAIFAADRRRRDAD